MKEGAGSRYLFAVADGLGGHHGGATASATAIEAVRRAFSTWDGTSPERFVEPAAQQANLAIFDLAHAQPDLFNMQTTLTVAVIADDRLVVAHVGDCRLYRARDGQIDVLTHDHSMVVELLRMRMISPEQAIDHPGRHQLTRSLGAELLVRVDVIRENIQPGDVYLLCCDGLWGEVTQDEVRNVLEAEEPEAACRKLVDMALEKGAPDNVTAIVVKPLTVGAAPAVSSRWRMLLRRGGR
jgi:PPM family protein phosphatase